MYLEQRVEKAFADIEKMRREIETLNKSISILDNRFGEMDGRLNEAIRSVSASSGVSPEALAKLMVEIAQNIYPVNHPTAPKGGAQDDGPPKDKPGTVDQTAEASQEVVGTAQKAEASPPPLSDEGAPAPEGGGQSPEVVAPSGEASASPAVDATKLVVVEGRNVHGPRASVFVQPKQAKILKRLLQGAATLHELSVASDTADNRETTLRMANMRTLLSDAGLQIKGTPDNGRMMFSLQEMPR